ncbi:hypothetical protein EYF80_046931 [Liparis tanakae]|uniref:Uncharacterized protein n=1 Tax=Liparis tanakae TaxID=230148 RepID=A0A4Z2FQA5_9TELE|nr:hypothetical protein EYF80_046931 [Liparis tanakae]
MLFSVCPDLLQQHGRAHADGVLQGAQEVGVRQLDDLEAVLRLFGADPSVGLRGGRHNRDVCAGHLVLRVDHERPAPALGHQDAVLRGHGVAGQTLRVPLADHERVAQDVDEAEAGADGDVQLLALSYPLVNQLGERKAHTHTHTHTQTHTHTHTQICMSAVILSLFLFIFII